MMTSAKIRLNNIHYSLSCLGNWCVISLTFVRNSVKNITSFGLCKGVQFYSPFSWFILNVPFYVEHSFEFYHCFVNGNLMSGMVQTLKSMDEIGYNKLYFPHLFIFVNVSISVIYKVQVAKN